jgi:hypothetical protein
MSKLSNILRSIGENSIAFFCPGCKDIHIVNCKTWNWNGDVLKPTFSPSVLVTAGHYMSEWQGPECWCNYLERYPNNAPTSFKCVRCHSFVKDGQIEFLGDCSHKLAGKTVPLPEWNMEDWDNR